MYVCVCVCVCVWFGFTPAVPLWRQPQCTERSGVFLITRINCFWWGVTWGKWRTFIFRGDGPWPTTRNCISFVMKMGSCFFYVRQAFVKCIFSSRCRYIGTLMPCVICIIILDYLLKTWLSLPLAFLSKIYSNTYTISITLGVLRD